MYILHIGNKNYSSWSLRPWAVMQALKIPFSERVHPLIEGGSWDEFQYFSPTGKVPCLVDEKTTVWDSLAIVEYVAEEYPQVWPSDKKARAWARCVAAEMHSGFQTLRSTCGMNCGVRIKLHEISPAVLKDVARIEEIWAQGIEEFGGPYLAGDAFTAADAFFAPVVFRIQTYGLPLNNPIAKEYYEELLYSPALQTWYKEALQEKWQLNDHEIGNKGEVIEDFRKK
jgi:glutathione S-transferase